MSNFNNNAFICVAVSSKIYEGDGDKAPQIGIEMRVVEGPEAGRTLFWYGSLHENAQQFTAEALRTMGWSCNDIGTLTGLGSTRFRAVEKTEEYKGKTRTRWMIFGLKSAKATLADDDRASFGKQFKALALAVPAVAVDDTNRAPTEIPAALPTNGSRTTAAPAPGGTDGPIPF